MNGPCAFYSTSFLNEYALHLPKNIFNMKLKLAFGTMLLAGILSFQSCKTDQKASASDQELSTHDHSNHDHSHHDHSNHNHGNSLSMPDDSNMSEAEKEQYAKKKKAIQEGLTNKSIPNVDISTENIPNPCKILPTDWLVKNTSYGITEDINIKRGSSRAKSDNRSCFFQWEYEGDPNAGFLVSIMVNPVPQELEEFPAAYMLAKRMDGEAMMGQEKRFPYKPIEGLGEEALGCYDLGKYYWRLDNEHLFHIAFNMPISKNEQEKLFMKLAKEVTKNFNIVMQK